MHLSRAMRSIVAVASMGATLVAAPAWAAPPAAGAVLKSAVRG
ncbi:hypothetical protein [Kitasatospora aureofaciens]